MSTANTAAATNLKTSTGRTFPAPTSRPDFVSGRNQGQIVEVGASVAELDGGGFVAVGYTFDRSGGLPTIWKVGKGRPNYKMARADAIDMAEMA